MTLHLELPDEVLALLGNEPQQEVLKSVLLHLIQEKRMTVAKAGEILGLGRMEAIRWYTSHGYPYPNYDVDDFRMHDLSYAEQG